MCTFYIHRGLPCDAYHALDLKCRFPRWGNRVKCWRIEAHCITDINRYYVQGLLCFAFKLGSFSGH